MLYMAQGKSKHWKWLFSPPTKLKIWSQVSGNLEWIPAVKHVCFSLNNYIDIVYKHVCTALIVSYLSLLPAAEGAPLTQTGRLYIINIHFFFFSVGYICVSRWMHCFAFLFRWGSFPTKQLSEVVSRSDPLHVISSSNLSLYMHRKGCVTLGRAHAWPRINDSDRSFSHRTEILQDILQAWHLECRTRCNLVRGRHTYRAAHTVDLWPDVGAVSPRDVLADVWQAQPDWWPQDNTWEGKTTDVPLLYVLSEWDKSCLHREKERDRWHENHQEMWIFNENFCFHELTRSRYGVTFTATLHHGNLIWLQVCFYGGVSISYKFTVECKNAARTQLPVLFDMGQEAVSLQRWLKHWIHTRAWPNLHPLGADALGRWDSSSVRRWAKDLNAAFQVSTSISFISYLHLCCVWAQFWLKMLQTSR